MESSSDKAPLRMSIYHRIRLSPRGVILALVAFGFGVVAASGHLQNSQGDRGPSCVFEEYACEFGEMAVGDQLSHEFRFRNTGQSPMHVLRVVADCGCVVHALEKRRYRPGETGRVRISLNTDGLVAPRSIQHSIWFEYSHAGEVAGTKLRVVASLSPDIEFTPREVTLASHSLSDELHARVTIDRRMLSPEAFRKLQIEKRSSQITIHELLRTSDSIVIDCSAVHEQTVRGPQTIDLLYEREGLRRNQRIVVHFPATEKRVTIRPPSYVAIAVSDESRRDVSDSSKRTFQLVLPDKLEYRIASVKASENLGEGVLAWQVLAEAPDQFALWVEQWPLDRELVKADLTITYCDVSGTIMGQCFLPVYISQ